MKNKTDIYALLDRGSAKRRTAETLLNKQSSRSHSVFCITVSLSAAAAVRESAQLQHTLCALSQACSLSFVHATYHHPECIFGR